MHNLAVGPQSVVALAETGAELAEGREWPVVSREMNGSPMALTPAPHTTLFISSLFLSYLPLYLASPSSASSSSFNSSFSFISSPTLVVALVVAQTFWLNGRNCGNQVDTSSAVALINSFSFIAPAAAIRKSKWPMNQKMAATPPVKT